MSGSVSREKTRSTHHIKASYGFGDNGDKDACMFGVNRAADPVALNDFSSNARHAIQAMLDEGIAGSGIDANRAWIIQHLLQAVQAVTDCVLSSQPVVYR